STLFEKVGLPTSAVNEVLASDKQAKQFTQLKHGQKLEFELAPNGQLKNLHSNVSDLESITLTKGAKGFAFNRITTKPVMRSAYV
ncbi:LysM-like peptidoglycan-binding domain-containing protein, partial [Klebsiella pneumoniae]